LWCRRPYRWLRNVDAEKITIHRQRITDATLAIQRITRWQGMQDCAILTQRLLAGGNENLAQIACFDFLATQINTCGIDVAGQTAGRYVDDQAVDCQACHTLGCIDSQTNDAFNGIQIGDDTGLHTARTLVANTDDLNLVGTTRQHFGFLTWRQTTDHADDLGRADIQHGNDM